ncbi:MAG: DUF2911 domain-containing protein [Acidobacteriaceae bacterium]
MKSLFHSATLSLTLAFTLCFSASAQMSAQMSDQMGANHQQPPSPSAMTSVSLDGAHITIHYSSPAKRGRAIMGGLVPYGQVWRTGANQATSFVTSGEIKVGTLRVPAGSYTLFTLPQEPGKPWLLILSKKTGEWGIPYPAGDDLGRTPMHYTKLPQTQQSLTISFQNTGRRSTQLHVRWENTDESVLIQTLK